jgi:signal transduction histidine kinase
MTTPDAGAPVEDPSHVWNRAAIGWTIAFWSFIASAVVVLLASGDLSSTRRALGLTVITVLGLSYGILRPARPTTASRWQDDVYLLGVAIGCGLALAIDSNLSLLLFIAYSQMWMYASSIRRSLEFVVALTLSASLGFLSASGWKTNEFWIIIPTMGTSLVFTVLFGVWVSRIIEQSRERAELISQLEATRAELGEAHHAQGVTAERERMAREIHDTLAQGYTSIIMLAQVARADLDRGPAPPAADPLSGRLSGRLDLIEDVARENLAEARSLVAAFGPVGLDGTTLAEAVQRLAQRFSVETGVAVDVIAGPESDGLAALSREREVVLLRSAQESLTNVRRHAEARRVRLTLAAEAGTAWIEVSDDGVGFDPSDPARPGGFGLSGMRDRAHDAGGQLDLVSGPGRGTCVTVRVPAQISAPGRS